MNDLRLLLDGNAIAELLTRYLRAVDPGDVATRRASHPDGATEEHGGLCSGPAQGYVDTIEAALSHPADLLFGLLFGATFPPDVVDDGIRV
ncbi:MULTISPECIES: hypothetical protein [unclassified Pseudonocardia]|uniref:hypothetical protein n=1 Tax=unclassified Pseudonocardia TaxID=2619320 RepID=UPI000960AC76|nr:MULTISPECIES: hypothetical protein [unclassified Pseudonocardia]MBN9099867.1 hypothetical protein [Pseudonocardia sp.]OJY43928.1 MAG: hypothetical protein BGP03_06480 [Pseudonocardia sp. 73-21]